MTGTELAGGRADGRLSYEELEHELKTPLTTIRSLAESCTTSPTSATRSGSYSSSGSSDENRRMAEAVERLLGYLALQRMLI